MITTIVFDWGGVMANDRGKELYIEVAALMDVSYDDMWQYWHPAFTQLKLGAVTENGFWYHIEQALDRPLAKEKYKIWDKWSGLHPYPEMIDLVTRLKNKGYQTVLLSNAVAPTSLRLREKGYFDLFSPAILSHEIKLAKPDTKIYDYTLKAVGVTAPQCIFVDDLPRNIGPAETMGFHTVLAQTPQQIERDIHHLLQQG